MYERQRNFCNTLIKKTKRNFYTIFRKKIKLQKPDGIVDGLNIKRCEISKEHSDPMLNAIKTIEKHPNILKIKELNSDCRFSFEN